MNEADPSPINLDELRLLPDWLREEGAPPSKRYASHEGSAGDESRARRGSSRPGMMNRDPRDNNRGFGRGNSGNSSGGGERRRDAGGRTAAGPRAGKGRPMRDERRPEPDVPTAPASLRVEFLPDEKCLASINKQIRSTHMAYPLFGLARMFLQEPARHWVQLTAVPGTASTSETMLYQLGEEGPVTLDRNILERIAFDTAKDQYYVEQTEQKEPPKGNYTNVARNRLSGTLLGPTNYHGYQPALRAEYEGRFSRRMSFEDYRRNIEVVNDPVLVERWKEDARTTTTIATLEGEPPTVLQSASEARAHFRQHYFDQLMRTATFFKVHGSVARHLPEPAVMQSIRQAHDAELRYPAQFVQLLRQGLQNAGLHIFKHRKRIVYVSLARPVPFAVDGAVSEGVAAILETVAQNPLCTRKVLAEHVLTSKPSRSADEALPTRATPSDTKSEEVSQPNVETLSTPESQSGEIANEPAAVEAVASTDLPSMPISPAPALEISPALPHSVLPQDPMAKAKAALAADLRFLVQAGHLIEFHNGTFDLPLPPRAKEEPTAIKPMKEANLVREEAGVDPVPATAHTDAHPIETGRADLRAEAVAVLPPEALDEVAFSPESGSEKTEVAAITESDHTDRPGIVGDGTQEVDSESVVIGDTEGAHPFSPS